MLDNEIVPEDMIDQSLNFEEDVVLEYNTLNGSIVKQKTDLAGNTTTKQESGYSLELKFFLEVELKFQISQ